jgi:cell division protein ZapA (FtsZ GTPase activity inhibitor)
MKGGIKMEKNQLWSIIGVAFVVAVLASITTVYVTGNVIHVLPDKPSYSTMFGKTPTSTVYTVAEIDAKLKNLTTNVDSNFKYFNTTLREDIRNRYLSKYTKNDFGSYTQVINLLDGDIAASSYKLSIYRLSFVPTVNLTYEVQRYKEAQRFHHDIPVYKYLCISNPFGEVFKSEFPCTDINKYVLENVTGVSALPYQSGRTF